jgi:MYXO-CTERM domain-containing protein
MGAILQQNDLMHRNHWFGVGVVLAFLGFFTPDAEAKGSVRITFTTQPAGGAYQPNNVLAVWFQNAQGQHVRTIGRWAAARTQHLVAYRTAAGTMENVFPADAISDASRLSHAGQVVVLWNLKDKNGQVVPDGTYTIRLEVADGNSTTAGQNNQGTFTFVKGANAQTQTNLANGGFTQVTIEYDPNRIACGDGVVDAPETCDHSVQGSCVINQTGCAQNGCQKTMFTGDPMQCTADCVNLPLITECKDNDGCCADGCTPSNDRDCRPGGGSGTGGEDPDNPEDLNGGCSIEAGETSGGGLAMFALFVVIAFARRRRR